MFFIIYYISQNFLFVANFGGVMGCAIGMSVAAACELIYWLTLKPVAKLMVRYNINLSEKAKYVYNYTFRIVFLAWCLFSFYHFRNVYLAFMEREY